MKSQILPAQSKKRYQVLDQKESQEKHHCFATTPSLSVFEPLVSTICKVRKLALTTRQL